MQRDIAAWRKLQVNYYRRMQKVRERQSYIEMYKDRQHRAFLDVIGYRDGASKAARRKYRRASAKYDGLEKRRPYYAEPGAHLYPSARATPPAV